MCLYSKRGRGLVKVQGMFGGIETALEGLGDLVRARVREMESGDPPSRVDALVTLDAFEAIRRPFADIELSLEETVAFAVGLYPLLQPHLFDEAVAATITRSADYPRMGGIRGKDSRLFIPTAETVMFLLGASTVAERLAILHFFDEDHVFTRRRILMLESPSQFQPTTSGVVRVGEDIVDQLLGLPRRRPRLGPEFPAQRIATELDWDDLILNKKTLSEILEIETWIRHGDRLLHEWGMKRFLRPGYRALFFGSSGTGKTLTASLLGKQTGRDVYRIDLSMLVSKFIGETEKNLSRIFSKAEDKGWILFFDEADALFGKRTAVKDSHDRYANQEVSYLLQRVECFEGLVILASNFRANIDEAFLRRFQSVIHFPRPDAEERRRIWLRMMPKEAAFEESIDLNALSSRHDLTGANIANVIQYASLQAMARDSVVLTRRDIEVAIAREFEKEGKLS